MTNKLEFKLNRDNLRADTDNKSTLVKKSFKMSENASNLDYKAMYADIINTFGYINNPIDSDAVYITKSGKFLDTKGPYNDHQHINIANYLTDKYHYKDADANNGSRFMSQIAHAIRVTCWNKGAGLKGIYLPKQEITQLQYDAIAKFANAVSKKVNKDNPLIVATENGSQQIEYTKSFKLAERVVNDIKYYYQTGKLEIVESLTEAKAITWGDLDYAKKTDTRKMMSGRGTGHFGTGFYFVGEDGPYGINGEKFYDYEPSRPIYEIDLDKYKLFKPKDNESAYKLHDALRQINNYYSSDLRDFLFKNIFSNTDKLEDELYGIYSKADSINEDLEDETDLDFDDTTFDYSNDNENDDKKDEEFIKEYTKLIKQFLDKYQLTKWLYTDNVSVDEWIARNSSSLGRFEKEIKDAIEQKEKSIYYVESGIRYLSNLFDVSENTIIALLKAFSNMKSEDSISTLLLKELGYEGVDVTHLNHDAQGLSGLDNFSYGTVIYDLKPGTFRKIMEPRKKANESLLNEDKVLRLPKDVTFQFINRLKDTYKGISLKELPIDKLVKDNDLLNDDDLESYHQGEWEHAKAKDFHIDKTKLSGLRLGNTPFVVQKKDGTLKLSDGRHRTRAAYNDGYTHVEYPTYVEESLTEDKNSKEDILDALDKEFGQEELYMWSTYILPNGHFLNPDNAKEYWDEIGEDPIYEHCDFEDWAYQKGYNLSDIYNNCIKMNVTYPYLSMPDKAKPTQEQLNAIRKILDRKDLFEPEGKFYWYDIFPEEKVDSKGGNLLAVYTPVGDELFDLDVSDADDIIKAINQAYVRGGFFNESLKESVIPLKDCPTDIIIGTVDFTQYVKNKINNIDIRVFYDTNKDWYLVAPAYNSIHDDIIEDAINAGYYEAKNYDAEFTGYDLNKLDDFASYIHKQGKPFVICTDIENPEDIYPYQYKLNVEGTIVYVLSYYDLRELDFIHDNLIEVLKEDLNEKIVKKGNKWQVQSEKGKNLGTYDTKPEAEKRLKQVHYFKHINEEDENYIQNFKTRTQQHIDRVNKYAKKIDRSYPNHDNDKFNELFNGYSLMSKENVTEEEQKLIDDATYKHVLNNEHHCEHWCKPENIKGFSRKNPTPNGCLDCSKMPEYALEEMCCDWCAMSEEFNNTPFEWYEKNKDTRWHFNEEQDKFILDTLHKLWDTEKSFKHVNEELEEKVLYKFHRQVKENEVLLYHQTSKEKLKEILSSGYIKADVWSQEHIDAWRYGDYAIAFVVDKDKVHKANDTDRIIYSNVSKDDFVSILGMTSRTKTGKENFRKEFNLDEDLTKEQEDYFKNSKIRDEKGNLLICYHGTENPGFKEFDARKGKSQFGDYKFSNYNVNYFTTNKETAVGYTDLGYEHDDNVYACYLDVVNPYIVNNRTEDDMYKTWQNIKDDKVREKEISYFNRFYHKWKNREKDLDELNKDLFYLNFKFVPNEENENYYDLYELSNNNLYGAGHPVMYAYSLEEFFDDDQFVEFRDAIVGDYEGEDKDFFHYTVDNLIRWVLLMNEEDGTNYDGIIVPDIYDIGPKGSAFTTDKTTDIITLKSSNQIKRIDNLKPTSNSNIDESRESASFELGTAGYILPNGSFVYMNEYHGEDEKYRSAGHVEFSNTHCEEDTCVRIFKEPNDIQYKKLEEVIDKYLDEEEYCKVEINNDFYEVFSLREDACQDPYWDEKIGNWTGYKLVQIIRNYFNAH